MYRLFEFFYQYRAFLFFVFLETICIWLIVNHNNYQGAAFFNSSNRYVGGVLESKNSVQSYFELKQVNAELAEENARLKQKLVIEEQKKDLIIPSISDCLRVSKYQFLAAKVINNSIAHFDNYITINKGKLDGINVGMGIISSQGVVGKINECSDHYCTGLSLLNRKLPLVAKIKIKGNKKIECRVQWDGVNPTEADLNAIPRHQKISMGDTIVTSGYDTFFPEGIMVGTIKEFRPEGGSFWKAKVALSTDFTSLSYVYVIGNKMEAEQDTLEIKNNTGGQP